MRILAALPLAALIVLIVSAPAQAAPSVDSGGGGIIVSAGGSPLNVFVDNDGAGHYLFSAVGISTGLLVGELPCGKVTADKAMCAADGVRSMLVGGTSGADSINTTFAGVSPQMIAIGHAGGDTITTGEGDDAIASGAGSDVVNGAGGDDQLTDTDAFGSFITSSGGNDTLRGGAGNDTLDAGALDGTGLAGPTSGGGHDLYDGGTGGVNDVDTVDYSQRTAPVTISVDSPGIIGNLGNDGQAGEQDNVINAERLIGGSAADIIFASGYNTVVEGRAGDDGLNGSSGNDTLLGGDGSDQISGSDGGDTITPGRGNDIVDGGADDDTVDALDGYVDAVACGTGDDTVTADSFDTVNANCEHVTRAVAPPSTTKTVTVTVKVPTPVPPKPGPVLALPAKLKASAKGQVRLRLLCPAATKTGCLFGKLTITTAPKTGKGRRAGSASFSAKPGTTAKLTVKLSASARRTLAKKRRLAVKLTAVALNGDAQSRTTTKALTIKR